MKVNNIDGNNSSKNYRTIWMEGTCVFMIEQNLLPFEFKIYKSENYKQTCHAIKTMIVRGAGAIGAAAGFAMAQASTEASDNEYIRGIQIAKTEIEATRPTARNLFTATERVFNAALISKAKAVNEAQNIADEDAQNSLLIGEYGNELIKNGFRIETHCNAGWLAFVDYGTALSPIYLAHKQGKEVFIYVDETRPRNQGAKLTAWELQNENIPYAIIADNAGAHLMSKGKIDMIITGADRIAANGDVANKIGTLEKAIAAKYYNIPFYVAAPKSTFDLDCRTGDEIIIEERDEDEILYQIGLNENHKTEKILISAPNSKAINPAFDVTPADLITGIFTERGIIKPKKQEINKIFNIE
ncbi:MAG: S-methyl-5-thioribose-1-phosphate isomerase [Bacteroidales bacterium]|nr:S-methyl-5-thioribose-1-phosphate isomerase [Bacteroidales bacterium]MBN2756306.1 S-methyl-5-thioribose-1-phosphate isomerase [Bacteroidales bacterium]